MGLRNDRNHRRNPVSPPSQTTSALTFSSRRVGRPSSNATRLAPNPRASRYFTPHPAQAPSSRRTLRSEARNVSARTRSFLLPLSSLSLVQLLPNSRRRNTRQKLLHLKRPARPLKLPPFRGIHHIDLRKTPGFISAALLNHVAIASSADKISTTTSTALVGYSWSASPFVAIYIWLRTRIVGNSIAMAQSFH